MKDILLIDIGGTETKYSLSTKDGSFIESGSFPTIRENGEKVLEDLTNLINSYKELIEGVAISLPGFINPYTGYVPFGGAIADFKGINLKETLKERTGFEVEIENDVNCVAMAEKWKGNAKESSNFLCMTIGTGIGGGIFINDKLYRGNNFMAGEFGFMLTNGLNNHVPHECTLSRIGAMLPLREKVALRKGLDVEKVTGKDIFNWAKEGDITSQNEIDNFYNSLAVGLYNLTYLFNPEKILLGGGISTREDLVSELMKRMKNLSSTIEENVKLDICKFKNDSGKIGALYHYLEMKKEK